MCFIPTYAAPHFTHLRNQTQITTLTLRGLCFVINSYNKIQRDALVLNFILVKNSTCFRQIYCPSPGVLILHSQQLVFAILVMFTVPTSLADSQHIYMKREKTKKMQQ